MPQLQTGRRLPLPPPVHDAAGRKVRPQVVGRNPPAPADPVRDNLAGVDELVALRLRDLQQSRHLVDGEQRHDTVLAGVAQRVCSQISSHRGSNEAQHRAE